MKIVYLSNFMNQHQLPLSKELYAMLGDSYRYIALSAISDIRKQLGQEDMNKMYPFIVCEYESDEQKEYARKLISECDVLIAGHCSDDYLSARIKTGKVVIKTSERYFKEVPSFLNRIKQFIRAKRHLAPFQGGSMFFLCASAYTSADVNKYTKFCGKTYKWGYFPECRRYDNVQNLIGNKENNTILWVGRFLDWKHPEIPILVANRLKEMGYNFKLKLIGVGDLESALIQMVSDYHLEGYVNFLGPQSSKIVREYMEKSQIYMFTSDQAEGWGAVLNESMNSGCAVVANDQIGSVPFLVKNRINGLVYSGNDVEHIYQLVKYLMDNPNEASRLGENAYHAIVNEWSPEIAAKRLVQFCEEINDHGQCDLFNEGPCSRA